jgi:conjugal transfer ATP-binding protein TraC
MSARTIHGARASALFPVLACAPEDHLFLLDDQSLGFAFQCRPLSGAESAQAERLSVLLNQEWPKNTFIQALLWASPDIEEPLARMRGLRLDTPSPLLREATRMRSAFLRQATTQPLGEGLETRVRDLQVVIAVKLPIAAAVPTEAELREARELRATAQQILATAGLDPEPFTANRYVRFMQSVLNWGPQAGWRDRVMPECDPQRLIREQLLDFTQDLAVDGAGLTLGETARVQTCSVKRFPEYLAFGQAAAFLGDPLSGNRGVRHNVLICLTLHLPDAEAAQVKLTAGRQWATNMANGRLVRFLPALERRKQDFDLMFERLEQGDRSVQAYLGIVLITPPQEAVAALGNLRTYWRELGFQVMPDKFFSLPLFLHNLPFGPDRKAVRDLQRYRTVATAHAVALLPIWGDWKGTGTPVLNLISRVGQLQEISLWDSRSNYNAVVAAQSGSGKSFLTNELISTNLSVGGRCWVIDVGRSYENLCAALDGQFLAFSAEANLCLNPFELIRNWEEEADLIAALITAMAAPTEPLGDFRSAGLKRVLKGLWDRLGTALSIDAVAEGLRAEDDERLRDVGNQLYPFTRQGEYGRFFDGPNTVAFDRDLVVLELEELKGRKHLQQVVLLLLIYQIQQVMYLGARGQTKLVVIDEAWDLLTQGDVAKFIETGYRRFRKYNGAAITVTQSLNDLYGNPTGRAIAENCAFTCLLAQPGHTIDQLLHERRLPMSEAGAQVLKTVHTVPGLYSEIMVLSDAGAGIGRLVVDPFRRLLYSTQPHDVAAIGALRDQGLGVEQAIRRLLGGAEHG